VSKAHGDGFEPWASGRISPFEPDFPELFA